MTNENNGMDMLNGSLWNKILMFALPVAATGILEQLFNASDIAIVGNFASGDRTVAVAAVGANTPVVGFILNFFIGISASANVLIANAIGRNDKNAVSKTVYTAIITALIGGFLIAICGGFFVDDILNILNVPEDVSKYAGQYLKIYLMGMPAILLFNFEAAIFRSVGETKLPLAALTVSGVINVLLNLCFVIVFGMNVDGVALATVISNVISSAILFLKMLKTDKLIKIRIREMRFNINCFRGILKIGLPAGIQGAVFSLSNIVIQSSINSLGTVIIAASSAACNIESFVYYVLSSFGQACTTFVGQNYGAGKPDRCKRVLAISILEDFLATALFILMVLVFGRNLLAIFNPEPEVVEIGYTRLLIIFTAYTFSMLYENVSGYLRGFRISVLPAILAITGVCGVRFLWIFEVFSRHKSFKVIMLAYPISLSITAVLNFIALFILRPAAKLKKTAK